MNVFVIGAHGHVGHTTALKLVNKGNHVMAGVRNESEFTSLPKSKLITPIKFDLTKSIQDMTRIFKDNHVDAVIFSAGAGGGVSPETTLKVDLDGAVKSIKAAKNAGITRYLMVSAAGSDNRKAWNTKFGNFPMYTYYLSKHYADLYLHNSGLNYTILHPVALSNHAETNKIQLNPKDLTKASVSRADVANVLVETLSNPKTYKKDYTFSSGPVSITKAF